MEDLIGMVVVTLLAAAVVGLEGTEAMKTQTILRRAEEVLAYTKAISSRWYVKGMVKL